MVRLAPAVVAGVLLSHMTAAHCSAEECWVGAATGWNITSPISVHDLKLGTLLGPEKTAVWLGSLVTA
jgi:hypothetical protein